MNHGEKHLIENYKKRHYDKTRGGIMKTVVIMGVAGCSFGGVLNALNQAGWLSLCTYILGAILVGGAGLLYFLKGCKGPVMPVIVVCYFCFVYIPVDWFLYEGVLGSTPYIALIIMVIVVLLISKKHQKVILTAYLLLITLMVVHSIVMAPASGADMQMVIRVSASVLVASYLIAFSLAFLLTKYERMYEQFLNSSVKDKLTGALNRRALDDVISTGETQYNESQMDYAVVMLDIDKFKALNDTHGHAAGDTVLRNFAECVRQSVRATDYVVRYGGDEFLLMLPGATMENVQAVYRRIEEAIAQNPTLTEGFKVSFSRGLAYRSQHQSSEQLINAADKRMYASK